MGGGVLSKPAHENFNCFGLSLFIIVFSKVCLSLSHKIKAYLFVIYPSLFTNTSTELKLDVMPPHQNLADLGNVIDNADSFRLNINRAAVWDCALRGFNTASFSPLN